MPRTKGRLASLVPVAVGRGPEKPGRPQHYRDNLRDVAGVVNMLESQPLLGNAPYFSHPCADPASSPRYSRFWKCCPARGFVILSCLKSLRPADGAPSPHRRTQAFYGALTFRI
jgi:hypothetical protein